MPSSLDDAAALGAEILQAAGDDASKAADQEPAGAAKCAYCNIKFESGDRLEEFNPAVRYFNAICIMNCLAMQAILRGHEAQWLRGGRKMAEQLERTKL